MKRIIPFIFIFFIISSFAYTEILSSPSWGYTLDLPEGYTLTDKMGNDKYMFASSIVPVELIISLYPLSKYKTPTKALTTMKSQLQGTGNTVEILWREKKLAISQIKFSAYEQQYTGWMHALELPQEKGIIVMLAYTPEKDSARYENFIISTLDSIYIDRGSWYETGPMTAFVYPPVGEKQYVITIAGKTMNIPLDIDDAQANQYLIEREFEILTLYSNTKIWLPAWQRYYRSIYRDAYKRLKQASFIIYNTLSFGDNPIKTLPELASTLLAWTQYFTYTRVQEGSDFISIPKILIEKSGDCDSRAVLLAILLHQMNCETTLFISPEYSHALAGFKIEGNGARMETNQSGSITGTGKNGYLVGETTAKVAIGQVAQDISDYRKWFAVLFPK